MIIKKFQEGGMAPAAPVQGGEDQMMQQLAQMAQEIIGQLGPEGAAALADIIMQMLQSQAPVDAAPQEQQFMRCGGKIKKKAKRCACGGSVKANKCGGKTKKCCKKQDGGDLAELGMTETPGMSGNGIMKAKNKNNGNITIKNKTIYR